MSKRLDEEDKDLTVHSTSHMKLDSNPSCIEFSPSWPEYFIIGTYELHGEENDGELRRGLLLLGHLNNDSTVTIVEGVCEITNSAVLDLHFAPRLQDTSSGIEHELIAVALASGEIALFKFLVEGIGKRPQLFYNDTLGEKRRGEIITSLAWCPFENSARNSTLCYTTTKSKVGVIDFSVPDNPHESHHLRHDLEVWTAAWLPKPSGGSKDIIILSGGDDSTVQTYTRDWLENVDKNVTRRIQALHTLSTEPSDVEKEEENTKEATKTTEEASDDSDTGSIDLPNYTRPPRLIHYAGVTAILPLKHASTDSNISMILTGSYDEHLRVLSMTSTGTFNVLASLNLGGGVWRLKLIDTAIVNSRDESSTNKVRYRLLASCMHAGCRIVAVEEVDGFWRIRVLAKMEEHKSMNYASDFVVRKDGQGEEEIVIVSTSFYDRLVCLWQVPEVEVDETYGKKEEM